MTRGCTINPHLFLVKYMIWLISQLITLVTVIKVHLLHLVWCNPFVDSYLQWGLCCLSALLFMTDQLGSACFVLNVFIVYMSPDLRCCVTKSSPCCDSLASRARPTTWEIVWCPVCYMNHGLGHFVTSVVYCCWHFPETMIYDPKFEYERFDKYVEKWRGLLQVYNKEMQGAAKDKQNDIVARYQKVKRLTSQSTCQSDHMHSTEYSC